MESTIVVRISNYRSISRAAPLSLEINEGITFILGKNNIGKSNLFRFFLEFRNAVGKDPGTGHTKNQSERDSTLPHPYDWYSNRQTPASPIEVQLTINEQGYLITVSPKEKNRSSKEIHTTTKKIGNPSQAASDRIQSLFSKALFIGPFRSSESTLGNKNLDVSIGGDFIRSWNSWANGHNIANSERIAALTEELRTIFSYKQLRIDVSEEKNGLFITSEDGRFSINELGSGISHYIVALGNALISAPDYIFIDEPEISLHPLQQEIFVRSLAAKAKVALLATSHSVGLARSSADKIYSLAKDHQGNRRLNVFGEASRSTISQSISEMGYSQFCEIGGNNILLVEGRTDIKSLREILRKYSIEQHFIIWSLNGSDWIKAKPEDIKDELSEIKRLNPRSISVIFDSERTSSAAPLEQKIALFEQTCASLGFNTFPTDYHSTENYITQAALDQICPGYTRLEPYEAFASRPKKWPKSRNWLMFREMNRSDIDKTGLGKFIETTLRPACLAQASNQD